MKKKIIACILLVALMLTQMAVVVSAANGGEIAADSRNGVVRVITLGPDGGYSLGSAFGIGKVGEETDTFVTNHHVIYGTYYTSSGYLVDLPAVTVWIMKNSNAWNPVTGLDTTQCIPCEIVYAEEDGYPDMAILKAVEPVAGRVALPLLGDESTLDSGDNVYALGYPGSSDDIEETFYGDKLVAGIEDVTLTNGVVSRLTTSATYGNTRLIQHTAQVNHGNSGGPLLDENGAVVGINTYIFGQDVSTGDSISSASVRISHVIEVLDDLDIEYELYKKTNPWIFIAIALVVAAGAAVAVVMILKKKNTPAPVPAPIAPTAAAPQAPAADPRPRLQCLSGALAGQRYTLEGTVRIGRDPARNDLVLPASTQGISGVHCVISVENGIVWLKDVGSTYGTYLASGQRLAANEAVQLKIGDRFWLGSEREVFVIAPKGGI